jgi:fatty-acyl-CoA synthase
MMTQGMMYSPLLVSGLIKHAARFHGDTEVVSVETDGQIIRTDWFSIEHNARLLASALGKLGLTTGERCGTIAWNNRRHLEIYFGVPGAGMVCHTINPRIAPELLVHILEDAADRVLFVDLTFLPLVAKLRSQLKLVEHIVLMGPRDSQAAAMLEGLQFYEELIETGDQTYEWPAVEETAVSSLCYTSGTTGNPKGVAYTHRSTVLHSLVVSGTDVMAVSARDSVMPVVPMFHVNAWGTPYIAAQQGAKLVLPGQNLDGESLAKLIDAEQVTLSLGVPTIWMGLLGALRKGVGTASSMKRTIVGGAALPPSMLAAFRDEFGIELIHAWGMTETSPVGTLNQLKAKHTQLDFKHQSELRVGQGRPPYGVNLRIVDEENVSLPSDGKTEGKLQIRGHWIAETYYGMDTTALTADGWFDTGDIATIDMDGFMVIRDRAKDLIKSGGEWISSVELENIAVAHPGISNAAAIAGVHPKWDERPIIIAVRAKGEQVSAEGLLEWFDGKIPSWQCPDAFIFVDALPIGGTGKVLKNRLRKEFGDVLVSKQL